MKTTPKGSYTEACDCCFDIIQQVDYQYTCNFKICTTFTGKELDSETGYSYFGARYYDAELSGLFFSVDPMADKYPNISSYAYCAWNPVKLVDPDGREMDDYRIYSNGTIEKKVTPDNFDRFIFVNNNRGEASPTEVEIGQFDKNENGLIKMPSNFSFQNNDFGISIGFSVKKGNENHSYISGEAMAALLGALVVTNTTDLTVVHFSNEDGTSPAPSVSHKNGNVGDLRYLRTDYKSLPTLLQDKEFDINRQNALNDALYKFGWEGMLSENFTPYGEKAQTRLNHTKHYSKPRHNNHLHLGKFNPHITVVK
ncbi:MAG: RHS repeat-associated core domain-containing protein [Alphaproteobacteria bacterium]|nr:RHS repeat-associated core domain-containing protein [Alphaproteobacteria bacterium]